MKPYPELDDLLDYSPRLLWAQLDEAEDRMTILRCYEDHEEPTVIVAAAVEAAELERYADRLTRALLVVTGASL
jgi:hypothetical protein